MAAPTSIWTKVINLDKELLLENFSLSAKFGHVANIVANASPSRQTVIEFSPTVADAVWKQKTEWIYIFTIDKRVVKIGGTRDGLYGRQSSYMCGHHTSDRGKSGKCSVTNAHLYNTFDHYIRAGHVVEMWACEIPAVEATVDIWGTMTKIRTQAYTAYETGAMDAYSREAGHYPPLSDNSDPSHRKAEKVKRVVKSKSKHSPPE